jgi:hypothetical protein
MIFYNVFTIDATHIPGSIAAMYKEERGETEVGKMAYLQEQWTPRTATMGCKILIDILTLAAKYKLI